MKGIDLTNLVPGRAYPSVSGAKDVHIWLGHNVYRCPLGIEWTCWADGWIEDEWCLLADVGTDRMWMPAKGMEFVRIGEDIEWPM